VSFAMLLALADGGADRGRYERAVARWVRAGRELTPPPETGELLPLPAPLAGAAG